ncbi:alpha/beta hydrolase [Macrococcus equipercicus]|uniref:Alpha/beta hydrolase n=2 Tax=Macrococcus equipercicus TaxID=69967 RepID=A0ABQ6R8V1_9STAP|nr:alpha/beta hydrolase [Macrococcus equipercicus]
MMNIVTIELNGISYHVIDEGAGIPILLLHGFPDSNKLWHRMIPLLTGRGYRVIAPDLRGYGDTAMAGDAENYSVALSAKDLFDLLLALDIRKIKVVGHDWGAILGWYLAAHYPTIVESYTALSVGHPKAYFRRGTIKQLFKGSYVGLFLQRGLAEKVFSAGNYFVLRKMAVESEELKRRWLHDMTRPGRLTAGFNWYRGNFSLKNSGHLFNLPNVAMPVLGIIGQNDPALTTEQMVRSGHYVNGSFQHHIIEDEGHWLPETCPEQLVELITAFHQSY